MAEISLPLVRWLKGHVPSRETVDQYRLLRPFATHLRQPSLWRLNRRSVPRGVAVGLFVAVLIPFMHTFVAAILAIPARANVAVAALLTLVVNPITIPPMYIAAYRIGSGSFITMEPWSAPAPPNAFQASSAACCSGFIMLPVRLPSAC
jgi:Uncharacterized protein conserved in bacteria